MEPRIADIDFETLSIMARPDYPPAPVGLSIIEPGKRPKYWAWGHPCENNCTKAEAVKELTRIYKTYRVRAHNAKFDLEVAEKHFGLPLLPPHGFDDSMLQAFLYNPRVWSLKLKDLAADWLGMPADEQSELRDWIFDNIKGARQKKSKWGELIYLAPGKLVGKYANGDTLRAKKLSEHCMPYIKEKGMEPQYEIEKRVVIKAIEMERTGIMIDYAALEPDLAKAEKEKSKHEKAIFKKLGDINLNSGPQKVEAFERLGLVDEWEYTEKGNPMTGIDSLLRVCTDKKLVKHLDMFSKYDKIIGTYMKPWLESALANGGRFYPWFNTIKGDNDKGTYTGRFSSNFQQVPRKPLEDYKMLPFLRSYVAPDKKNHILFNRDFSQQELRILAHFTDGDMLQAYLDDPKMDAHNFVGDVIKSKTGIEYPRSYIKGCNFLIVYGGGPSALSRSLKIDQSEASDVFSMHRQALPEVKELSDDLIIFTRQGNNFKTAGGRWYTPDEGFEYITLNTLIQGSAADHTKRALLNISDMLESKNYDARLILTVHDEFMISGPKRQQKKLMADFKEAMEYDELFDVPMLSDGKIGERWGNMIKVKEV